MINIKNTTLLIAGPIHQNTIQMIEKYRSVFKIIVSTYKENKNVNLDKLQSLDKNLVIIESQLPEVKDMYNSQNIYYQCFSVLNGLQLCKTEYVMKLRSDEFYSNLDKLVKKLPSNKISTSNIFVRDVGYKPFHLSDHIIVGGVELIFRGFQDLKRYIEQNKSTKHDIMDILNGKTPAETKIFLFSFFNMIGYCIMDWHNLNNTKIFAYLKKYFFVFDVKHLMPYSIKSSVVGEITDYEQFVKNDTKLFLKYCSDIDSLKEKSLLENLLFRIKYKIKKKVKNV